MKKRIVFLLAIAAMAAVFSCTKTEEAVPEGPSALIQRDFTALVTKTALSGSSVVWQADDEISVFASNADNAAGGAEYTLKDYSSPSSSATFTGSVAEAPSYFAVYPYSPSNTFVYSTSTITAAVPVNQVITAGSFAPGAAVVVGKSNMEYEFYFQNAVALLKVTLEEGMGDATKIEISGNNGEKIAGAFTAAYNGSAFTFADADSGTSAVANLTISGGTFTAGKAYYIAIRPTSFTKGLTAKAIFAGDKVAVKTSDAPVELNAGQILPLGTFDPDSWTPSLDLGAVETLTLASGQYITFDAGTPQTLTVLSAPGATATLSSALATEGWSIDTSSFASAGTITVTPPSYAASHAPAAAGLTLSSENGTKTVSYGLRLRGIGSVEELQAMAVAQAPSRTIGDKTYIDGAYVGDHDAEACAPYLYNGEFIFTADLNIPVEQFDDHSHAYALHHNEFPINGNGRTVDLGTYEGNAWPLAFIQDLYYDVHDLTLTGNLSNSADNAIMGSLATRINSEVTVSNVSSSVNITYKGSTSANAFIGGIVGNVISSNKNATFDNCSYSGIISCSREVIGIGGIVARGEASGTAVNIWTTIQNCKFSGSIEYTPNAVNNKQTGIGGLIGISARRLKLINCSTSGSIVANMENMLLSPTSTTVWESVKKNTRGIGGVFGVTYGTHDSSPYAGYYLDNVVSSTTVTVNGANASQSNNVFQIRGYNGATTIFPDGGSVDSQGRKNILLDPTTLKVVYNYYTAPAISAVGTTSFSYGEAQDIHLTPVNLDGWTVAASAPAGWNVDTGHVADASPYITVTPPTQDAIKAGTAVGMGSITFTLTSETYGSAPSAGDGVAVRLYGINSKEEFNAFKAVYGAAKDTPTITGLDLWLVDGKVTLNSDLTFSTSTSGDFQTDNAYVLKFLTLSLEGNDRTITLNATSSQIECGLLQGTKGAITIQNLNFDGTITVNKKTASGDYAFLAERGPSDGNPLILTNVNVLPTAKIDITKTTTVTGWNIGGLVGRCFSGQQVTFNQCEVAGSFVTKQNVTTLGGFIGNSPGGTTTAVVFNDCVFSGSIEYKQTENYGTGKGSMVGGFVGKVERVARFTNCTNSGTLFCNAGGVKYSNSDGLGGFGGFVGVDNAAVSGNTMEVHFNNVTTTDAFKMEIINVVADEPNVDNTFGRLIGHSYNGIASQTGVDLSKGTFTISYAE